MKMYAILLLVTSQSAFALTGVIESKVLGNKTISVDYAAVRVIPVSMTTEIVVDHDSQEESCQNSLVFQNVAQAIYQLENIKVQESQTLLAGQNMFRMEPGQACVAPSKLHNTNQLYLARGGYPEFLISEEIVNGETKQLMVLLSLPRQIADGKIVESTSGMYTIKKLVFGRQAMTVNFSVVEVTASHRSASTSYLEHGSFELK